MDFFTNNLFNALVRLGLWFLAFEFSNSCSHKRSNRLPRWADSSDFNGLNRSRSVNCRFNRLINSLITHLKKTNYILRNQQIKSTTYANVNRDRQFTLLFGLSFKSFASRYISDDYSRRKGVKLNFRRKCVN